MTQSNERSFSMNPLTTSIKCSILWLVNFNFVKFCIETVFQKINEHCLGKLLSCLCSSHCSYLFLFHELHWVCRRILVFVSYKMAANISIFAHNTKNETFRWRKVVTPFSWNQSKKLVEELISNVKQILRFDFFS